MLEVLRKPHELKGQKTSSFPHEMIFFDVESNLSHVGNKIIHTPYLVCAVYVVKRGDKYSKQWIDFSDMADFWNWVCSKTRHKAKLYIFAHNVSYDIISSRGFDELYRNGFEIDNFYNKGRAFILDLETEDKRKICVLDTGNYYSGTVKGLGKAFGIEKLSVDFYNYELDEVKTYCYRDVEIIMTAMIHWIEFCRKHDLGKFGRTCPSQSFNAFRHKFMRHQIYVHDRKEVCHLERMAYNGGRVECWRIGQFPQKMYYCDVNSMYPYVMHEFSYPTRLITHRKEVSITFLKNILENYLVCVKVRIKTDKPYFPVKIDGKIIFPVGEFITYLSTPEVVRALDENLIVEVMEMSVYEHHKIFADFVDFFYHARLEAKASGDKVHNLLFKLMLNSLYGKFGQKAGGWTKVGKTDLPGSGVDQIYDIDTHMSRSIRWIAGVLFEEGEEVEATNGFCAVASHVTAYARMLLYEYAENAGVDNVYYMDTDSLFVNQKGYENLCSAGVMDNDRLGALKVETEIDNIIIHAPKDYKLFDRISRKLIKDKLNNKLIKKEIKLIKSNNKTYLFILTKYRCKGIPPNAKQLTPNSWEVTVWGKLSSFVRNNSLGQYYNIKTVKTLKRNYTKGIVVGDKVLPINLTYNKEGEIYASNQENN